MSPVTQHANSMPFWTDPDKVIYVNWLVVESSNVDCIGWPVTGEPLMLVRYRGGRTYGYLGVSRQRCVAAANAKSVGRYINQRIRGHFRPVRFK